MQFSEVYHRSRKAGLNIVTEKAPAHSSELINLWLTLLHGAGCQHGGYIGHKSPGQSKVKVDIYLFTHPC